MARESRAVFTEKASGQGPLGVSFRQGEIQCATLQECIAIDPELWRLGLRIEHIEQWKLGVRCDIVGEDSLLVPYFAFKRI